jgi:hypothetical protein
MRFLEKKLKTLVQILQPPIFQVTIDTLLTDEALKPIRRSVTPDWTRLSERKHENWQRTTDPRNLRPQVKKCGPGLTNSFADLIE